MISIRSNFFYTRTVPCELWFFDKGKPKHLRDKLLMIDARNIYRKVTRKVYDFTPEQMANISAIVWLYRGQKEKFLGLVKDYLGAVCREAEKITNALSSFECAFSSVDEVFANVEMEIENTPDTLMEQAPDFLAANEELAQAYQAYSLDRRELETALAKSRKRYSAASLASNAEQHAARKAFDPIADQMKSLAKQIDLIFKLAARTADEAGAVLVRT